MKNTEVRLGIIGLGNMGAAHAQFVREGRVPGLRVAALCSLFEEELVPFSDLPTYTDYRELIGSGEVDAVLIATPHPEHVPMGIAALSAGLHTLIEKPISVNKREGERLVAAHQDKDIVFAAMFNQRTDPRYQKLQYLIASGELGAIQRISWNITDWYRTNQYYASGGWRATWSGEGGGVLLNQCPHQLDLWQWLFGMPQKVRALCQIGRFHEIEVEDAVTAVLEYESGTVGTFVTTTGEAPGVNRLEVAGERGLIVIDENGFRFIRNEESTTEHLKTCKQSFGKPDVWNVSIPFQGQGEQHIGILKNFAAAVLRGEPLIAPAAEGLRSIELANAMLLSGALNETIELPMDGDAYEAWLEERIRTSTGKKPDAPSPSPTTADDFAQSF